MKKVSFLLTLGVLLLGGLAFLGGCGTPADNPFNGATNLIIQNSAATTQEVVVPVTGTMAGDALSLTVTSNKPWKVAVLGEDPNVSWVHVGALQGAVGSAYFKFNVEINPNDAERHAKLVFTAGTGANMRTITVNLRQEGALIELVDPADQIAKTNGDTGTFQIKRSSRNWTVESDSPWLTLNPTAGDPINIYYYDVDPANYVTVNWTAAPYDGLTQREAIVTFTCAANKKLTVKVIQKAIELTVDPVTLNYLSKGATKNVTVNSNRDWTATIVCIADDLGQTDWATIAPASGSADVTGTIAVTVTPNKTASTRTATISVKAGEETKTVAITQDPAGIDNPYEGIVQNLPEYKGDATYVDITTANNQAWEAKIVGPGPAYAEDAVPDWFTISHDATADPYSKEVKINYTYNPTNDIRKGAIKIYQGSLKTYIDLVQAKPEIKVQFNHVDWAGNTYDITDAAVGQYEPMGARVTNRENWTVTSDAEWLKIGVIAITDPAAFYETILFYEANPTETPRTANITFKGSTPNATAYPAITRTIAVTQKKTAFVYPAALSMEEWEQTKEIGGFSTDNGLSITFSIKEAAADMSLNPTTGWCQVDPVAKDNNTLIVYCKANPGAERACTIVVKCGEISHEITLTQTEAGGVTVNPAAQTLAAHSHLQGAAPAATNEQYSDLTYSTNGIKPVVTIAYDEADQKYTDEAGQEQVYAEDWLYAEAIHVDDGGLTPEGYYNKVHVYALKPNQLNKDRKATVTIKCGDKEATLTVTQVAANFVVTPLLMPSVRNDMAGVDNQGNPMGVLHFYTEWGPFASGSYQDILAIAKNTYLYNFNPAVHPLVTTNIPEVDWTVSVLAAETDDLAGAAYDETKDWFVFRHVDLQTFRVEVVKDNDFVKLDSNGNPELNANGEPQPMPRKATFLFKQGLQPAVKVTITQRAGEIELKDHSFSLDAYAYNNIIYGESATTKAVWICRHKDIDYTVETKAVENGSTDWFAAEVINNTIRIDVEGNPDAEAREGRILVKYGRMFRIIKVNQKAAALQLSTTDDNVGVVADPMKITLTVPGTPASEWDNPAHEGEKFYVTATNLLGWEMTLVSGTPWFQYRVSPASNNVPAGHDSTEKPGSTNNGDIHPKPTNIEDLTADVLHFYNIEANDKAEERVCRFRLTNGTIVRDFTVSQPAAELKVPHIFRLDDPFHHTTSTTASDGAFIDPDVAGISSDPDTWTVSTEDPNPWFSGVERVGNDIVLKDVQPNTTTQDRIVELIITCGKMKKVLQLVQPGVEMLLSKSVVALPSEGAASITKLDAGWDFLENFVTLSYTDANGMPKQINSTHDYPAWTLAPEDGGFFQITKAAPFDIRFDAVAENKTNNEREARITFACGAISQRLVVTQGTEYLALFKPSVSLEPHPQAYVPVNDLLWDVVDFTVGAITADWFKVAKDGIDPNRINITDIKANPTNKERTAIVPISFAGNTVNFTVIQAAGKMTHSFAMPGFNYILLNATQHLANPLLDNEVFVGNPVYVYANNGLPITATTTTPWITSLSTYLEVLPNANTFVNLQGTEWENHIYKVALAVEANPYDEPRTGEITFKCGDMTWTCPVVQAGSAILVSMEEPNPCKAYYYNPDVIDDANWQGEGDALWPHVTRAAAVYNKFAVKYVQAGTASYYNDNWTVDPSTEPWIRVSRAGDYVQVEVDENTTGVDRIYGIVIRNEAKTECRIFRFVQHHELVQKHGAAPGTMIPVVPYSPTIAAGNEI